MLYVQCCSRVLSYNNMQDKTLQTFCKEAAQEHFEGCRLHASTMWENWGGNLTNIAYCTEEGPGTPCQGSQPMQKGHLQDNAACPV